MSLSWWSSDYRADVAGNGGCVLITGKMLELILEFEDSEYGIYIESEIRVLVFGSWVWGELLSFQKTEYKTGFPFHHTETRDQCRR